MPPKKTALKRKLDSEAAGDEDIQTDPKRRTMDLSQLDLASEAKKKSGHKWNLKLCSWNVNGLRAWIDKGALQYVLKEDADIICLQETKCKEDKLPEIVKDLDGYHCYWLSGEQAGYSGIGLLSKKKPSKVSYGIDIERHDNEGRVVTAEYEHFYLVGAYVPNAGRGLVRLNYRQEWDKDFANYLKSLDEKKPVILMGDLNVAHQEIDLANPKTNKKTAGFTMEERNGFSDLLAKGFVDGFRNLYPDQTGAYTFWTYLSKARERNIGWRLDYSVVSERFVSKLCDCIIRKEVQGSDHCPIIMLLNI